MGRVLGVWYTSTPSSVGGEGTGGAAGLDRRDGRCLLGTWGGRGDGIGSSFWVVDVVIHRFVRACVRACGRATAGKGRRRGDNLAGYCRGDPSLGMGVCISRPKAEEVTDARVLCTEDTHRYTQIHTDTHVHTHAKPTFTTSTTAVVVVGAILYREKHTVNPRTYFEGEKLHTPLTPPHPSLPLARYPDC